MDRKQFLSRSLQAAAGALVVGPALLHTSACAAPGDEAVENGGTPPLVGPLTFTQIALPFKYAALEPSIDAMTMEIHYTKHHAAYVKNVNEAVMEEGGAGSSPDELFTHVSQFSAKARNNSGGAWNHNMFWQVMAPGQKGAPQGKVLEALNESFGDFEKFQQVFTDAGMKRFGSGWAWLVEQDGKLVIGSTPNQDNPLMDVSDFKGKPLLALDVWEHAYYLKYQNKRNEYVANWWKVVNWDEVAKRIA